MLTTAARSALLALLLALAACQPASGPAESAPSGSPAPQATAAAEAAVATPAGAEPAAAQPAVAECSDPDFAAFLKRFESSADAQRAASADPLTMVSIDADAQPEPAPVSRQVPLAEVEFPVMSDASRRQAEGLEQVVQERAGARQEVTVRVPDSGIQTRYEFHAAPCWTLVRVSDDTF